MQFLMILPFFLLIHFAAKLPPVWPGRPQLWPGRNCESVNKNPVELNLCIVQTNSDLQGSCLFRIWWLDNKTWSNLLIFITTTACLLSPSLVGTLLRTPSHPGGLLAPLLLSWGEVDGEWWCWWCVFEGSEPLGGDWVLVVVRMMAGQLGRLVTTTGQSQGGRTEANIINN